MSDEFRQRFSGRYFGKYRGIVSRVEDDPNKLGRIMARVPVILGADNDVGWCWPAPSGSGVESGFFCPPSMNDVVWVEFEEGDPNRPVWSPGPWGVRDNKSMVPKHGQGETDDIDNKIRGTGIIPASSFAGEYPMVKVFQSRTKHLLEFDDTPDHTRVQLAHNTGSRVEFLHDGSAELVIADEFRHYVTKDYRRETLGDETILGHASISYETDGGTFLLKTPATEILMEQSGTTPLKLGGSTADQPFILGNTWRDDVFFALIDAILALTVPTGVGPSGTPINAAQFLALKTAAQTALSSHIVGR